MALTTLGIFPTEPVERITDKLLAMIPTEQYRATVVDLYSLPQLFIAV
ncbi:hypothetical protein ACIBBB_04280 [Streptomyces sp. NPDC051217]